MPDWDIKQAALTFLGLKTPIKPDKIGLNQPMLVIGAGPGRTGSYSLFNALNSIGYNTYHMKNNLDYGQSQLWMKVANAWYKKDDIAYKIAVKEVIEMLKSYGFNATSDSPANLIYKELLEEFPNAKVILSIRDSHEWAASINNTIYPLTVLQNRFPAYYLSPPGFPELAKWIFDRQYLKFIDIHERGWFDNSVNIQDAMNAFENWQQEVIKNVPKDKLLIHNSKQGFEPICKFLEIKNCPTIYPKVNEGNQISTMNTWFITIVYGWPILFILFLFIIQFLYRRYCFNSKKKMNRKDIKKKD